MAAKKKAEKETAAPEQGAEAATAAEPAAEAAPQAEPSGEDRLAALEAEMLAVKTERDELKDRLIRALAEAENIRKRGERDRKDAETYGGTRLARDILSVYDNLGRALDSVDDALREQAASLVEGLELTRRELLNAFAKHRITPVAPEPGEKFDPQRHEAIFEAPVPGAAAGSVIQVMETGFMIADRLLRPARVGVATAVPGAPEKTTVEEELKEIAEHAAHKAAD